MSRRARLFIAALMAGSVLAGPALAGSATAQQPASDAVAAETERITAMLVEFREKLAPLLEVVRISPETFDRRLAPLVRAAIPTPPATGDWGFSMGFNFDSSVYDDPSQENRLSVATDAAACASVYPGSEPVFRHRAIARDGLTGHVCTFFGPDTAEGGALLSTALYVEGPDRHATLRFASAGTVEDDADLSEQLVRGVIDANLAVTDALGDLVVEALATQPKGGRGSADLIQSSLQAFAGSLKTPTPVVDRNALDRLLADAVPKRPEGDDRTWGSVVDFNIDYALGDKAREPDADGHRVLEDARGCLPEGRQGVIAHFRRWSRDGLTGHVCGVTTLEDDMWMLGVTAFTEGEGRRLRTTYVGSLAIDGQPAASEQLGRERLAAQVALAEWATDQAVDILIAAPAN